MFQVHKPLQPCVPVPMSLPTGIDFTCQSVIRTSNDGRCIPAVDQGACIQEGVLQELYRLQRVSYEELYMLCRWMFKPAWAMA